MKRNDNHSHIGTVFCLVASRFYTRVNGAEKNNLLLLYGDLPDYRVVAPSTIKQVRFDNDPVSFHYIFKCIL